MNRTLIVFARAPVAGRCKTRLIPRLHAQGAADLYARLLQRTLLCAEALGDWRLRLQALDAEAALFFRDRLDLQRWEICLQEGTDLGVRMVRALNQTTGEGTPSLLIGSDILDWTVDDLMQAATALSHSADVCLAPAQDGGFWLLGSRVQLPERVFSGLAWGTSVVYDHARARLLDLGLCCHPAAKRHDIDVPEDLDLHAQALAQLPPVPHWGGTSFGSGAVP